jgi:serine/threonine-protein kinase RsbT
MDIQSCVKVTNEWDIVSARQLGRDLAKEMGFNSVDQARITTAISELARNIYLYTDTGKICVVDVINFSKKGLEITAIDEGPGIEDLRKVMQDGYSTSGGLGAGLPGIKRLMDEFTIDSTVGNGTVITAVKWLK